MPDKEETDAIISVDRMVSGEIIVTFSDNSVALYTADDLTSLPNAREHTTLPLPE